MCVYIKGERGREEVKKIRRDKEIDRLTNNQSKKAARYRDR